MRIAFIFAIVLILLVTIFAVQNNTPIDITFLFWTITGSLSLVLVITLTLGVLIGVLVFTPSALRRRAQVTELKKSLRDLKLAFEELKKAAPIEAEEKIAEETQETIEESESPSFKDE